MSDPEGADAHYRDARYYDHTYARYRPDLGFYLSMGLEARGPVLELGVGTGRIAITLAQRGIEVVGVDRMTTMLERGRDRIAKQPARVRELITLVEGDFREVRLQRRFPIVLAPFNVLQHLYTREDLERALATVSAHLLPRGRLALDVLMPDPRSLARDPSRWYRCRPVKHPRDGRMYKYEESFDYDHETQIQTTHMRFTDLEDPSVTFRDALPQRQFFPRELEALLHYGGFDVEEHHGGFLGEPIDAWTESQVVVARRRR